MVWEKDQELKMNEILSSFIYEKVIKEKNVLKLKSTINV